MNNYFFVKIFFIKFFTISLPAKTEPTQKKTSPTTARIPTTETFMLVLKFKKETTKIPPHKRNEMTIKTIPILFVFFIKYLHLFIVTFVFNHHQRLGCVTEKPTLLLKGHVTHRNAPWVFA